jgi:HAD superfamily hydrolase (TIGR01509 family)
MEHLTGSVAERAQRSARGVLIDLDDTLFDHIHATRVALEALQRAEPAFARWSLDEFERRHSVVLERLHADVLKGLVTVEVARIERFRQLLDQVDPIDPREPIGQTGQIAPRDAASRAAAVAPTYREAYQRGWCAVPGAMAFLRALKAAGLPVAIVTNNGVAEQRMKIDRCGMAPLVDVLVTSEQVGAAKPDPRIFQAALDHLQLAPAEAVMIGDAWSTDITGAIRLGMPAIWINRSGEASPDPSVRSVRALEPVDEILALVTRRKADGAADFPPSREASADRRSTGGGG